MPTPMPPRLYTYNYILGVQSMIAEQAKLGYLFENTG